MNPSHSLFKKAFVILALGLVCFFATARLWESKKVIEWDITLYYSYLPATFIYDDLAFNHRDTIWDEALFFMNTDSDGNQYVKMTSGLAYLYAPFFFGAHAFALSNDSFPADGFSTPYKFALLLSDLVFALLGLWFLGKLLLRWFNQKAVIIALAILFTGTNLAYYTFVSPMSHVYNFALISMILYWFYKYLDHQKLKHVLLLGAACGLLVLIRPTNIMALLFPLVILVFKRDQVDFSKFFIHVAIAITIAFLVCVPQLLYWHYTTGSWIVYSYNGETFFFNDPEIWKGLFSYRKGWLVYSPVLVFSFIGFIFLFRQNYQMALAAIFTLLVALWVTFSWWCWWYGGGFGARALIDFLPFMAIAMAALIQQVLKLKWWKQIPLFAIMGYFCFTSLFMSVQYNNGIIHFDGMTKELFWRQYLINHYLPDYDKFVDSPDYQAALKNEDE